MTSFFGVSEVMQGVSEISIGTFGHGYPSGDRTPDRNGTHAEEWWNKRAETHPVRASPVNENNRGSPIQGDQAKKTEEQKSRPTKITERNSSRVIASPSNNSIMSNPPSYVDTKIDENSPTKTPPLSDMTIPQESESTLYMAKHIFRILLGREIYMGVLGCEVGFMFVNFAFGSISGGVVTLLSVIAAVYAHLDRRTSTYVLNSTIHACVTVVAVMSVCYRIPGFEANINVMTLRVMTIAFVPVAALLTLLSVYYTIFEAKLYKYIIEKERANETGQMSPKIQEAREITSFQYMQASPRSQCTPRGSHLDHSRAYLRCGDQTMAASPQSKQLFSSEISPSATPSQLRQSPYESTRFRGQRTSRSATRRWSRPAESSTNAGRPRSASVPGRGASGRCAVPDRPLDTLSKGKSKSNGATMSASPTSPHTWGRSRQMNSAPSPLDRHKIAGESPKLGSGAESSDSTYPTAPSRSPEENADLYSRTVLNQKRIHYPIRMIGPDKITDVLVSPRRAVQGQRVVY